MSHTLSYDIYIILSDTLCHVISILYYLTHVTSYVMYVLRVKHWRWLFCTPDRHRYFGDGYFVHPTDIVTLEIVILYTRPTSLTEQSISSVRQCRFTTVALFRHIVETINLYYNQCLSLNDGN